MKLMKAPQGLMGAFELKVAGQNPQEFGNTLLPVTDMTDFYLLLNVKEQVDDSQAVTAPGVTAASIFTVPNGKLWRLLNYCSSITLAAGDAALTGIMEASLSSPAGGPAGVFLEGGNMNRNGVTNLRLSFGRLVPWPLLMPPGWSVTIRSNTNTAPISAGTAAVHAAILVQEFDI